MKKFTCFLGGLAVLVAAATGASAASVSIVDNPGSGFFDVFYTPSDGREFAAWDLNVTPAVGGLLDPSKPLRGDDVTNGAANDTFANTVFSSLGAGPASYIFSEYHPGQAIPPVPAQPNPTVGATPPNPDQLRWTIFDTNEGDGAIEGLVPYHMARVLYTLGGAGSVNVAFFEGDVTPSPGGEITQSYGALPNEDPNVAPDGAARGWRAGRPDSFTQQFSFTDDQDSSLTWTIESFTHNGSTPPTNFGIDSNGLFTWDASDAEDGHLSVYNLVVRGTDSDGGFDLGSVSITMPEPGTMVLAGMGLMAFVTSRRKLA